ncbi:MAG: SPOR domain-containing protein [Chloroherpetonaceae bacterium]|nr:SPOR domain-containing protein [Chloroherpetonaceae bacterium]MDW8436975.1 SPOR domain-containing protein [Chloroherpetonaceae bacterium]
MVRAILFGFVLAWNAGLLAQPFAKEILQAASAGDRKALEALRSQPLNDEERLIVNALLEIDGAVAARLYQSLIAKHPSSPFVRLADSRLREYNLAIGGGYVAPSPPPVVADAKPSETKPDEPKPAETKPTETKPSDATLADILPTPVPRKTASSGLIRFAIQFGSFFSRAQAETLQKQLRSKVATRIVELPDPSGRTAFKVRSEAFYDTKSEATEVAKKLNLDFYVVAE